MKPVAYRWRWNRKPCALLLTDKRKDQCLIQVEGEKAERVVLRSEVTKA